MDNPSLYFKAGSLKSDRFPKQIFLAFLRVTTWGRFWTCTPCSDVSVFKALSLLEAKAPASKTHSTLLDKSESWLQLLQLRLSRRAGSNPILLLGNHFRSIRAIFLDLRSIENSAV